MNSIYFDNNATGFIDPRVADAMSGVLKTRLGNPSSPHSFGQAAKGILSQARRTIASFMQVPQSQIIFTSGGTEGAHLLLRGFARKNPHAHILSSNIEHPCVFETLESLKEEGAEVTYLPAGLKGAVDPADLEEAITPKTKLICLMAVNNETGVKIDMERVAALARAHQIPLIVDGVAWLGKEKITLHPGISAVFFSGHKIHAPQGIGFVVLRPALKIAPQMLGGGQEFGLRGGTENLPGIVGLAKAISILEEELEPSALRIQAMRDRLESALLALPGVYVNGSGMRVCNTTNLSFEGIDGETLLIALDQQGIAVSLGSACSSGAIEPSRVLTNMGLPLSKARSSLRFSLSRMNTMEEIEKAISIIEFIRSRC